MSGQQFNLHFSTEYSIGHIPVKWLFALPKWGFKGWLVNKLDKLFTKAYLEITGYQNSIPYFSPSHARKEFDQLQKYSSKLRAYAAFLEKISAEELTAEQIRILNLIQNFIKGVENSLQLLEAVYNSSLEPKKFIQLPPEKKALSLQVQAYVKHKQYEEDQDWKEILADDVMEFAA